MDVMEKYFLLEQINLENTKLLDITKMTYAYEQGYLQTKQYLG